MSKQWTDKVDTAGVAKNGINVGLYINEMFWESLTDLWRVMILKHSVLQVVFHHIELGADLPDKELCSISSSIVCNQYIDPSWLPLFDVKWKDYLELNKELYELIRADMKSKKMTHEQAVAELRKVPPRGVYLQDFPELKLEEKKGLKYYYDKLLQAKDKSPKDGGSAALNELLKNREDGIPDNWMKDYKDFQGMSEAEKKLLTSQIDHMMKEVAEQVQKSRGTIPSELEGYIQGLDKSEPPKFDWKGYLRRFVGGSERVDVLPSRMKPNLRYPDNPGRRIRPRAHIMLAIDNSGSVSDSELKEFFHEIHHIYKSGTDITVVQCDAAISSVQKYKKGIGDSIRITSRGGTSFDEPVRYFNEHRREFACMVYFTDGEGPAPEDKIQGRCLWVHSSKSNINESLPGQKIKLEL